VAQAILPQSATDVVNGLRSYARRQVEDWGRQCDSLFQWERNELLSKEPSEEVLSRHAAILGSFIKNTESLIDAAANDDVYDARLREQLAIILKRLHISHNMYHSSMTTEEADRILAEVFPDGR
jgi:hypothetical protein